MPETSPFVSPATLIAISPGGFPAMKRFEPAQALASVGEMMRMNVINQLIAVGAT